MNNWLVGWLVGWSVRSFDICSVIQHPNDIQTGKILRRILVLIRAAVWQLASFASSWPFPQMLSVLISLK